MSSQIPEIPLQPVLPESWEQLAVVPPTSSVPLPSSSLPPPSSSEVPPPSSDAPPPTEAPVVAPKKKLMRLNPNASSFVPAPTPAPVAPPILQPTPSTFPPYQQPPPFDMFGGEYAGGYFNAYPGFPNLPPNMGFPPMYNQPEMLFDEQSGFA